jgi:hypothetical protein
MLELALGRALTQEDREFLHRVPDDTEEAPWMVMGDAQFRTAGRLAESLDLYVQGRGQDW